MCFGLFIAAFFATFKVSERLIHHWRRGRNDRWNALMAGALASTSLFIMDGDEGFRWTLSKYLAVRAGQCLLSHATRSLPQWKPAFRFGNVLVFGLSCAQLMYGFFVRQESLDADYIKFLERFVCVDGRWIELNRQWLRQGMDARDSTVGLLASFEKIYTKDITPQLLHGDFKVIPCAALHPDHRCPRRVFQIWTNAFTGALPMYFSLHLIPSLLFRLKHFIQRYTRAWTRSRVSRFVVHCMHSRTRSQTRCVQQASCRRARVSIRRASARVAGHSVASC